MDRAVVLSAILQICKLAMASKTAIGFIVSDGLRHPYEKAHKLCKQHDREQPGSVDMTCPCLIGCVAIKISWRQMNAQKGNITTHTRLSARRPGTVAQVFVPQSAVLVLQPRLCPNGVQHVRPTISPPAARMGGVLTSLPTRKRTRAAQHLSRVTRAPHRAKAATRC